MGREKELAQIVQSWRTVLAGGEPHLVLLRGEAGIGKTRLVEEILQWASRQGIVNANTRCYAAEGDLAYAPAIDWVRAHSLEPLEDAWLSEIARLLPEILVQRPDLPKPAALTESWQRQHLFEALSQAVLVKSLPLLLTIDDLQWCDRDTLDWLHFLLRFNREARLLIVGTYRPEEIGENHPLVTTVQALILEGKVTELDLRPLNEVSTKTLASLVAKMELSKNVAQHLFQETEGNPLFVIETVRTGLLVHDQNLNTEDFTVPCEAR